MARPAVGVIAAGLLSLLLVASSASAHEQVSRHETHIVVHHVYVSPKGRLLVNGIVRSDGPACRYLRFLTLMRQRPGDDEFLDGDLSSIPFGAWADRSDTGVVNGSRFYVKAERTVNHAESFGPGRRHHSRKIVCGGDRVPVELPAPNQQSGSR